MTSRNRVVPIATTAAIALFALVAIVAAVFVPGGKVVANPEPIAQSPVNIDVTVVVGSVDDHPIRQEGALSWSEVQAMIEGKMEAPPGYGEFYYEVTGDTVAQVDSNVVAEASGVNLTVVVLAGTPMPNSGYAQDGFFKDMDYVSDRDRVVLYGMDGKPKVWTECANPVPTAPEPKPEPKPEPEPEEPCYIPKDKGEYHTPENPAYQPPVPRPPLTDPTPGYTPGDAEESYDPDQSGDYQNPDERGVAPPGTDNEDGASDPDNEIPADPNPGEDEQGPAPSLPSPSDVPTASVLGIGLLLSVVTRKKRI